jgi:methylmalonyl-CoA/ethylmalonyl-CoA epimerase
MLRIEHIGIAIKNMAEANDLFAKLFAHTHYKIEEVASESVKTSFFKLGETKIELVEATQANSAIAKFIEKRGEGIHHIAFEVANIEEEMQRLQNQGFTLLNDTPKRGADNKLICFLHPKTTNGILVELCQEIKAANSTN